MAKKNKLKKIKRLSIHIKQCALRKNTAQWFYQNNSAQPKTKTVSR